MAGAWGVSQGLLRPTGRAGKRLMGLLSPGIGRHPSPSHGGPQLGFIGWLVPYLVSIQPTHPSCKRQTWPWCSALRGPPVAGFRPPLGRSGAPAGQWGQEGEARALCPPSLLRSAALQRLRPVLLLGTHGAGPRSCPCRVALTCWLGEPTSSMAPWAQGWCPLPDPERWAASLSSNGFSVLSAPFRRLPSCVLSLGGWHGLLLIPESFLELTKSPVEGRAGVGAALILTPRPSSLHSKFFLPVFFFFSESIPVFVTPRVQHHIISNAAHGDPCDPKHLLVGTQELTPA